MVYNMSMDKFKYILSPDNVYIILLEGWNGEQVKAELKGSTIIEHLRREYLLEHYFPEDWKETDE